MAPPTQTQGLIRLVASVADRVATTVHDVHRAVTDGGFRWVGPVGRPIKRLHDGALDHIYDMVGVGLRGLGELAAAAVGRAQPEPESPFRSVLRARAIAVGSIDADLLAATPELDVDVSLRANDGTAVVPDREGLRAAFPAPRGHLPLHFEVIEMFEGVLAADVWGDVGRQSDEQENANFIGRHLGAVGLHVGPRAASGGQAWDFSTWRQTIL